MPKRYNSCHYIITIRKLYICLNALVFMAKHDLCILVSEVNPFSTDLRAMEYLAKRKTPANAVLTDGSEEFPALRRYCACHNIQYAAFDITSNIPPGERSTDVALDIITHAKEMTSPASLVYLCRQENSPARKLLESDFAITTEELR